MPGSPVFPIYLEIGGKRTFASAVDWPGWARSGRDQASALRALFDYALRYASAIRSARLGFRPPLAVSGFEVVERVQGDATTDFGTPGRIPSSDRDPVDEAELRRLTSLLRASWRTFDHAVELAHGRMLQVGARGGGRDLKKIVSHAVEAQHAYITMSGWKWASEPRVPGLQEQRKIALMALSASAHGELPTRGPRGGIRWPARYFVRREAWHVLDHAWEIEDRIKG